MEPTHWPSLRWKMLPSLRPRRLRCAISLPLSLVLANPPLDRCNVRLQLSRNLSGVLALRVHLPRSLLPLPVSPHPAGVRTHQFVGPVYSRRQLKPPTTHGAGLIIPVAVDGLGKLQADGTEQAMGGQAQDRADCLTIPGKTGPHQNVENFAHFVLQDQPGCRDDVTGSG